MSTVFTDIPTTWTTDWTDTLNTGSWRAALPVHAWRPSPCHVECPVGGSIPRWINKIAEGDYYAAWLLLVENNPLPAVTGRVCHHPCETGCNQDAHGGAVGVNALEHFLADYALEMRWSLPEPSKEVDKRVAVIGGGPAGLSCAYHLRRLGYGVTIFDARNELGGLLRWGIPQYRLPREVLRSEIERLLALGIDARLETPISDADALAGLETEYDAIFVGVGAQRAKRLTNLADCWEAAGVLDGLDFLARCKEGLLCAEGPGDSVVVVGGGSAAIDAARSAWRLGAKKVTVAYRRERADMPVALEEIEAAEEEGITFQFLVSPAEVLGESNGITGVRLQRQRPGDHDDAGRRTPVPVEGSDFVLEADSVVVCVGEDPDLDAFQTILTTDNAILRVDQDTLATGRPGVFGGGDVVTTVRYVSEALGHGKRAAYSIAAYLGDAEVAQVARYGPQEAVSADQVNMCYFPEVERQNRPRLAVSARGGNFSEVIGALSEAEAGVEAARCLSCGTCVGCDNCVDFCPDMAFVRDATEAGRYCVLDQYCKGCGLCAAECPRGVIRMTEEDQ